MNLDNMKQWYKGHRYDVFVMLSCFVFILLTALAIDKEILQFPYIVLLLIGLDVLCFHTEKFFYLTCFIIPFSIELREITPKVTSSLSIPSELMLVGLALLFLCDLLINRDYSNDIKRHGVSRLFYFYFFWLLITAIVSTLPIVSFKFMAAKLWFILPAYFFFASLLEKNIKKASTFFMSYVLGLAEVVCMTTYKHIGLGNVRQVAYWVMSPYYNDHTAYGAVLAFFLPILALLPFVKSLEKWKKWLSLVLIIPIATGLYLSFSRAAWLSLIVAIGVLAILLMKIKFKVVFAGLAVVLTLGILWGPDLMRQLSKNEVDSSSGNLVEHIQSMSNISTDASNVERLNRWVSAWGMFQDKPVFGFGPGTYQFNYAQYQKPAYRTIITTNAGDGGNAHSEYLGPLSESGLLGMLIVITLVLMVLVKGINVYRYAKDHDIRIYALMSTLALITYFLHGILNNFLDTEKLAIPVFGAMAVIVVCDIKYKKELEESSSNENTLHAEDDLYLSEHKG